MKSKEEVMKEVIDNCNSTKWYRMRSSYTEIVSVRSIPKYVFQFPNPCLCKNAHSSLARPVDVQRIIRRVTDEHGESFVFLTYLLFLILCRFN